MRGATNINGYDHDAAFGRRVIDALDMRSYDGPMVLEGGSIAVDGQGTLITTEQCLLNANRNPNLTRQQIEERLALYLGVTRVIWLGEGLEDDETDGHVDNIACFAGPGRVMVYAPRKDGGLNDRVMRDNRARLAAACDARGRPFEIIEVPEPARRERHDGRRLDMSYINFYFANYGIVDAVLRRSDGQGCRRGDGEGVSRPAYRAGECARHRARRRRHPLHHATATGGQGPRAGKVER